MTDKYENHYDEWREEANRERWEREQSRRYSGKHPNDPDYIAPEEPEVEEDDE